MGLMIKKNDTVVVVSGKSKGKRGRLLRMSPDGKRGFVEGANLVKRFARRTRQNPQGGVVTQESSIHMSNLSLFCTKCDGARRFRVQVLGDGTKTRNCSRCGMDLSATK